MTPFRHVVLVGLSGSGKSTIGRRLAARLHRPFVDTDSLIEIDAGMPVPRVFAEEGEAAFRTRERLAVARALERPPSVIATGGGAPVDPENRRALWHGNLAVWLDAPVEHLVRRVRGGVGRPLLAGDARARLTELRDQRVAVYGEAHLRVDTANLTPNGTVEVIARTLEAGSLPNV